MPVRLTIYDLDGRLVRTLRSGESEGPGPGQAVWRGRDDPGKVHLGLRKIAGLQVDGPQ